MTLDKERKRRRARSLIAFAMAISVVLAGVPARAALADEALERFSVCFEYDSAPLAGVGCEMYPLLLLDDDAENEGVAAQGVEADDDAEEDAAGISGTGATAETEDGAEAKGVGDEAAGDEAASNEGSSLKAAETWRFASDGEAVLRALLEACGGDELSAADCAFALREMSATDLSDLAAKLASAVDETGAVSVSGEDGIASFDGLEKGVYLVVSNSLETEGGIMDFAPCVAGVGLSENEEMHPKAQFTEAQDPDPQEPASQEPATQDPASQDQASKDSQSQVLQEAAAQATEKGQYVPKTGDAPLGLFAAGAILVAGVVLVLTSRHLGKGNGGDE